MFRKTACALCLLLFVAAAIPLPARQEGASTPGPHGGLFSEMRWRNIGPLRGGRTKAIAGVPSQPFTFYFGMVNGGVWKTTNAGRTWTPIFDDQPTGSIGAIAVAPSDPNIIYVGSGEGLQRPDLAIGDGIYKSIDAGKTWKHLGLRDGQQIPRIEVDPKNPNRLFVAVLGHPYGRNEQRGIFRSTDGGESFERVLYRDENTGGKDVDIDPSNPDIVYATMFEGRQGPWENAAWSGFAGIFKSTDGGSTWKELTKGLPDRIGNAELAIAPSNPKRIYAYATAAAPPPQAQPVLPAGQSATAVVQGRGGRGGRGGAGAANNPIYRSDDAGETWTALSNDARVGTSNEASIAVDPKNPDWLIVTSQVTYVSEDGSKTWVPFKGAPGGDDYQYAWINPNNPDLMILAVDQGVVVSLDKGKSWSSWYNQPTAAMYHIAADNAFPYRVCGGQQDSGSACVASRGADGAITMREWHPAAIEEYGYAAPDPLDPDIVYGTKEVTKYDRRTGMVSNVGPLGGRGAAAPAGPQVNRQVRTQPIVFSMVDKKSLFFATNVLWKTMDGGITWKQISPDLTRTTHEVPKSVGKYLDQVQTANQAEVNGARVIYTIGPSYKDLNRIWAGTDDGVIATTADGGLHWTDVTPKAMGSYWKVFMVEPGRFDPLTAYAAVNTLRLDDQNPHLFRTHDGGKTWKEIVNGLPGGAALSAIREDVKKKGLLFAGNETQVFVSFDDGDRWESLRLNMAASSVRDLYVKDDDLIAGTHGRGIWILDDITPLRQIDDKTADGDALDILYRPQASLRVRWNTNSDTPLPPDEPRMPNPPEGGIIDYYLQADASGPVVLEVLDAGGKLVRRYSSADPITPLPDPATNAPLPLYWYRQPQSLSAKAGMHRFAWDVHYQPLPGGGGGRGGGGGLPISAVPFNTVPAPGTPWAPPGPYTVKLTVNGKTLSQPLTVIQDPRVKTPALVMQQVYTLSTAAYREAEAAFGASEQAQRLRTQLIGLTPAGNLAPELAALQRKIEETAGATSFGGGRGGRGGFGAGAGGGALGQGQRGAAPPPPPATLASAAAGLSGVMNVLQAADVQPTAVQLKAIAAARAAGAAAMARWTAIKTVDVPAINAKLKAAGMPSLVVN
jgi:photosystem II stability/assembly factor-like uncharacterized protein